MGKEEKRDGQEPEDYVRWAGFHCGAEKIGNDDEQDGSEDKIRKAKFLSEGGGGRRGLQFGDGRSGRAEGGQVSGPKSLSPWKKVALVCRVRKREAREFQSVLKNVAILRAALLAAQGISIE